MIERITFAFKFDAFKFDAFKFDAFKFDAFIVYPADA